MNLAKTLKIGTLKYTFGPKKSKWSLYARINKSEKCLKSFQKKVTGRAHNLRHLIVTHWNIFYGRPSPEHISFSNINTDTDIKPEMPQIT